MIDIEQIQDYVRVGKYGVFKASLLSYTSDDTNGLFRVLYAGQKVLSRPFSAYANVNTLNELITLFENKKALALAFGGGGGSVFGNNYAATELNGTRVVTSNDWVDILTLNTSDLIQGNYKTNFYAEYNNDRTNRDVFLRFLVDGQVIAEAQTEAKDSSNYYPFSSFFTTQLSGVKTLKIQGKGERFTTDLTIRKARIEFYRVS